MFEPDSDSPVTVCPDGGGLLFTPDGPVLAQSHIHLGDCGCMVFLGHDLSSGKGTTVFQFCDQDEHMILAEIFNRIAEASIEEARQSDAEHIDALSAAAICAEHALWEFNGSMVPE